MSIISSTAPTEPRAEREVIPNTVSWKSNINIDIDYFQHSTDGAQSRERGDPYYCFLEELYTLSCFMRK